MQSGSSNATKLNPAARLFDADCFCTGTLIATEKGEIPVEDLRVGDNVLTALGATRPIVWIGRRAIDLNEQPDPRSVRPFRVAASAFADGLPRRDLWLSPGHSVVSEGALTPISLLANGLSIAQMAPNEVEYWHVELDAHDILLAEGLPSESYLDMGARDAFDDDGDFAEPLADYVSAHWEDTCLPLVIEGPHVARAKARLLARLTTQGYEVIREGDPHIVVDGRRIEPIPLAPRRFAFELPAGGIDITLRSRTFVPAHTMPKNQDDRELGLCLARLEVNGDPIPLDGEAPTETGWVNPEVSDGRFAHRWTTGAAPLPAGARIVIFELKGEGYYWSGPKRRGLALVS